MVYGTGSRASGLFGAQGLWFRARSLLIYALLVGRSLCSNVCVVPDGRGGAMVQR